MITKLTYFIKPSLLILICIFVLPLESIGQGFGLGTDYPDAQAIFEAQSTNKGILIPRLTTTQRNTNITGLNASDEGLMIYNVTTSTFNYWDGSQWVDFPGGAATNDNDWDRNSTNGYLFPSNLTDFVGIGTATPPFPLSIITTNTGNGLYVNANFTNAFASGANGISTSINGASSQKLNGISQLIDATGTGDRSGIYTTFEGNASGQIIGAQNYFNNSGTGNKIGLKNQFEFGGGGSQYGVQTSFVLTGTGSLYGTENQFFSTSGVNHFGLWNDMVSSGGGMQFGVVNAISGAGTGFQRGVYNPITNDGTGTIHGVLNKLGGTGSAPRFGIENSIEDSGSGRHFGVFNDILSGGIGDRTGVQNNISNSSTGVITGIGNTISNIGSGTHYGVHTQLSGTGLGDKYGTKVYIDPNAGGIHYGIYSEATKSGGYSGYFLGSVYIGSATTGGYILPLDDSGNSGDIISTNGAGITNWTPRVDRVVYKDIQASSSSPTSGTMGTWSRRPLNTTEGAASFASLSGNQVTLNPGTYHIKATCPISQPSSDLVQSDVYDASSGSVLIEGMAMQSKGITPFQAITMVNGIVTIASNTVIELRSYSASDFNMGNPNTASSNHIFTILEIEKIN